MMKHYTISSDFLRSAVTDSDGEKIEVLYSFFSSDGKICLDMEGKALNAYYDIAQNSEVIRCWLTSLMERNNKLILYTKISNHRISKVDYLFFMYLAEASGDCRHLLVIDDKQKFYSYVGSKFKNLNVVLLNAAETLKELKSPQNIVQVLPIVHISYKHSTEYEKQIKSLTLALSNANIEYSIDEKDIGYLGSIEEYEKKIGVSDKVIMFIIPDYFRSIDCMFEMTEIFKNGDVKRRILPIVDMGRLPRNFDGYTDIKNYWVSEHTKYSQSISQNPGGSDFYIKMEQKINSILHELDSFWEYITDTNTMTMEILLRNNATEIINKLK